ncbi:MAG: hypothetical protein M3Z06_01305 [Actinomycetota bacterium]|nr:hypothetical protein [Actinomycetota bacterium]
MIVAEPPDELTGVDAGALDAPEALEFELELLLEPHAAMPSDAATVIATAPKRLFLNFFLLIRCARSLRATRDAGVTCL